jgi:hypothetical protein
MSGEPDHQELEMSDTTIDLTVLGSLTDTMLYEAWVSETLSESPVTALVREYEMEARRRGFDVAMVAAIVDVGLSADAVLLAEPPVSVDIEEVTIEDGLEIEPEQVLEDVVPVGDGVAAHREASGATVQDGEVMGDDVGFQGSSVKLLDGADSRIGTRVTYVKDGMIGEIVGYDRHDGYVKVKTDDGKVAIRSKRTLKSAPGAAPDVPFDRAVTAAWDAPLHPRGRDGKFIEKFGLIELFDVKGMDKGQRAHVTNITQDKKGRPEIEVRLQNPDGSAGKRLKVGPEHVAKAPEKARLPGGNGNDRQANGPSLPPPAPLESLSKKDRRKLQSKQMEAEGARLRQERQDKDDAQYDIAPLDLDAPPKYPDPPELPKDQPGWVNLVNDALNHKYEGGPGFTRKHRTQRNIAIQTNLARKQLEEMRKANDVAENQSVMDEYQIDLDRVAQEETLYERSLSGDPIARWQLARARARRERDRLQRVRQKGNKSSALNPSVEDILDRWGISRTPPSAPSLPSNIPPPPGAPSFAPPGLAPPVAV